MFCGFITFKKMYLHILDYIINIYMLNLPQMLVVVFEFKGMSQIGLKQLIITQ